MKVNLPNLSNQNTVDDLKRYTSQAFDQVVDALNGKLSFGDNINTTVVGVTFGVANTQVQIKHGLNRIPAGYIVIKSSSALSVYDGITNPDSGNIYLNSSAIGNVKIMFF